MSTLFPGTSIDNTSTLPNPAAGDYTTSPDHASLHDNANDAIKAVETKIGIGTSIPTISKFLVGTGAGASAWTKTVPAGEVVGTTDTQTLTNKTLTSPTINTATVTNPTITVDAISEYTTDHGVTIDGLTIKDGTVASNAITAASIVAGAVTPEKLVAGAGTGWALSSWTPTWTGVTVGNGTVVSKYAQIGKLVFCEISLSMGSTSAITGQIVFTCPVTARAGAICFGAIDYGDLGSADYPGSIYIDAANSKMTCWAIKTDATYAKLDATSATIPFTFGQGDGFNANFYYEAA
jgi:hypothetical protein